MHIEIPIQMGAHKRPSNVSLFQIEEFDATKFSDTQVKQALGAIAIGTLPPIHKDPFDRLLVAQAIVEGIKLLTSDAYVAEYSGPVEHI